MENLVSSYSTEANYLGVSCDRMAPCKMMAESHGTPKVLVVIANHGTKNRCFCERLLAEYKSMKKYDVDIVVLSDTPKNLGPGILVNVGSPIADPWSLPFGYKQLFIDRAAVYDMFIYSEDDMLITERSIEAFIETTRILPEEYIAGFMRFEVSPEGQRSYPDMHSHYH